MGFPRQEYWGGLPFPPPGDLPESGIEPMSLTSPALSDRFFTTSNIWEALFGDSNPHNAARWSIYGALLLKSALSTIGLVLCFKSILNLFLFVF